MSPPVCSASSPAPGTSAAGAKTQSPRPRCVRKWHTVYHAMADCYSYEKIVIVIFDVMRVQEGAP